MSDPKMTAEERIYPHVLVARSLDRPNPELMGYRVVRTREAIQACHAHAAAAVKDLEARVVELKGILHDAPTIAEVEAHAPGWLDRVRAALGKEAQP